MDTHPIRTARLKRKLSQSQLAAVVGATKSTISKWEAGAVMPRPSTVTALLKALPGLTIAKIYAAKAGEAA